MVRSASRDTCTRDGSVKFGTEEEAGGDLPGEEDDEVDELGLERDASCGSRGRDLVDQDKDGREVRQVAEQPKDVHPGSNGRGGFDEVVLLG